MPSDPPSAASLNRLSVDLAKAASSLQLLVRRNQDDLGEARRQTEELRAGLQKLALEVARDITSLIARVEQIERSSVEGTTQRHSTDLVRMQASIDALREHVEARTAVAVENTKGSWALKVAIAAGVLGGLSGVLSLLSGLLG